MAMQRGPAIFRHLRVLLALVEDLIIGATRMGKRHAPSSREEDVLENRRVPHRPIEAQRLRRTGFF